VKERKADGKEKRDTRKAQQANAVFTDYVLPIDFEDALVVAVADAVLKPKKKWGRHDAARRK
jgi:predicted nucleic acid-binding protein